MALGFYNTLVLEGAEKSLSNGKKLAPSVASGETVELRTLAIRELGATIAKEYELN